MKTKETKINTFIETLRITGHLSKVIEEAYLYFQPVPNTIFNAY